MITKLENRRWDTVQDLIHKALDEEGFELAELQFKRAQGRYLLRVYIDHKGGVGINDCEKVSKRISSSLDAFDLVPGPYILEVSSPGLDRPLKKEEDFIRFKGYWVKVTFIQENQEKQTLEGKIIGLEDHKLNIEGRKGEKYNIPYATILKARLIVNF